MRLSAPYPKDFESFVLHATMGYFKGHAEKSIVIEIVEAR
jgi:hypothetical protein